MMNHDSQPPLDLHSLIEQYGKTNPKIQMLAQLMDHQQAEPQKRERPASQKLVATLKKQSLVNKKLKAKNQKLLSSLNYLIDRNDVLAAALGACPDCWGDDASCTQCRGRGKPGAFDLDEEAFGLYVQPALEARTP